MSKHTPGPWDYFIGNANGRGLIRIEQYGTGQHIASLTRGAENEANARLIAAAPDLLAALEELMSCHSEALNSLGINTTGLAKIIEKAKE